DQYTKDFTRIASKYFMGVKVPKYLDQEQMAKFDKKYPELNDETFQSFLEELTAVLPDAGDLFSEALIETRFRVVREQYEGIKKDLESQMSNETDPAKRDLLTLKVDKCDSNLQYLDSGDYDKINYVIEEQ
ncbi:MAG TPA: hypothetical protein VHA74_00710, partial [Candidatus Dojkabacteria bacterium]|nr:hypothetical protein [Candidatus Dojkabacteria bacterium]